jgi:hypothetical protein
MGAMKILNVNARQTNQTDIALPFDTDEQVVAAWDHIFVGNRRMLDFSYRPAAEGEDVDRAFIDAFLNSLRTDNPMPSPDAATIRRLIRKMWGAELNYDIRELIGFSA